MPAAPQMTGLHGSRLYAVIDVVFNHPRLHQHQAGGMPAAKIEIRRGLSTDPWKEAKSFKKVQPSNLQIQATTGLLSADAGANQIEAGL